MEQQDDTDPMGRPKHGSRGCGGGETCPKWTKGWYLLEDERTASVERHQIDWSFFMLSGSSCVDMTCVFRQGWGWS